MIAGIKYWRKTTRNSGGIFTLPYNAKKIAKTAIATINDGAVSGRVTRLRFILSKKLP
jgi:hypothetical protein